MMQLYPAIDLRGGRCVRLRQGDYAQETVFGDHPAEMARHWVERGATYLHLVDLDGAKEGQPVNGPSVRAIVQAAGVPCQLGGGMRSRQHIEMALEWGVARVIIGTKAVQSPEWLAEMADAFPQRIVLGIDARDGMVATEGWLHTSGQSALELARSLEHLPLAAVVYTDISKDGMLQGPNVAGLEAMTRATTLPVIASGGVSTLDDVRHLSRLPLQGCIIGRALYEGRMDLSEALAIVQAECGTGGAS